MSDEFHTPHKRYLYTTPASSSSSSTSAIDSGTTSKARIFETKRKLQIFKEPNVISTSISQIVWTRTSDDYSNDRKSSCRNSQANSHLHNDDLAIGVETLQARAKLSNASCTSLPLPLTVITARGSDWLSLADVNRRRFSPISSTLSLSKTIAENGSSLNNSCNFDSVAPLNIRELTLKCVDKSATSQYEKRPNKPVKKISSISIDLKSITEHQRLSNKDTATNEKLSEALILAPENSLTVSPGKDFERGTNYEDNLLLSTNIAELKTADKSFATDSNLPVYLNANANQLPNKNLKNDINVEKNSLPVEEQNSPVSNDLWFLAYSPSELKQYSLLMFVPPVSQQPDFDLLSCEPNVELPDFDSLNCEANAELPDLGFQSNSDTKWGIIIDTDNLDFTDANFNVAPNVNSLLSPFETKILKSTEAPAQFVATNVAGSPMLISFSPIQTNNNNNNNSSIKASFTNFFVQSSQNVKKNICQISRSDSEMCKTFTEEKLLVIKENQKTGRLNFSHNTSNQRQRSFSLNSFFFNQFHCKNKQNLNSGNLLIPNAETLNNLESKLMQSDAVATNACVNEIFELKKAVLGHEVNQSTSSVLLRHDFANLSSVFFTSTINKQPPQVSAVIFKNEVRQIDTLQSFKLEIDQNKILYSTNFTTPTTSNFLCDFSFSSPILLTDSQFSKVSLLPPTTVTKSVDNLLTIISSSPNLSLKRKKYFQRYTSDSILRQSLGRISESLGCNLPLVSLTPGSEFFAESFNIGADSTFCFDIGVNHLYPKEKFNKNFYPLKKSMSEYKNFDETGVDINDSTVSKAISSFSSPLADSSQCFNNCMLSSTVAQVDSDLAESKPCLTPKFKRVQRLRFNIVQIRGFVMESLLCGVSSSNAPRGPSGEITLTNVQLTSNVKFDADEVFQSSSVQAATNCIFGEESTSELPSEFYALHVILTETCDGARISRPIGRVTVRRCELLDTPETFVDTWLPITRIQGVPCTEILGDICIDTNFDVLANVLTIEVLDYTVWSLKSQAVSHCHAHNQPLNRTTSSSSTIGQSRSQSNNNRAGSKATETKGPLQLFNESLRSVPRGRLFLRVCVSAGSSQYSTMKKIRVVESRGIDKVQIDCSQLLTSITTAFIEPLQKSPFTNNSKHKLTSHSSSRLPPPRPPPPRWNVNKKNTGNAVLLDQPSVTSSISKDFEAFENEMLLSRNGSTKSRFKARSRLLSSGSTSKSKSHSSSPTVSFDNPLLANVAITQRTDDLADSGGSGNSSGTGSKISSVEERHMKTTKLLTKSLNVNNQSHKFATLPESLTADGANLGLLNASLIGNMVKGFLAPTLPKRLPKNTSNIKLSVDKQCKKDSCFSFGEKTPNQLEKFKQRQQKPAKKMRLNIKVYCDSNMDESSYCGYVRVPLDENTMLPKDLPLGPNWFNIKSRSTPNITTATRSNLSSSNSKTPLTKKNNDYITKTIGSPKIKHQSQKTLLRSSPATTTLTQEQLTTRRQLSTEQTTPKHFRHFSTPSTSASVIQYIENDNTKALRGGPSLISLRSGGHSTDQITRNKDSTINYNTSSSSIKGTTKPVVRKDVNGSVTMATTNTSTSTLTEKIGEMRLRLWYSVDEILPLVNYQPLYSNLINSLNVKPYSASLTSLLQYLAVDMENIARPLMKIFVHANQIRQFFRLLCAQYVSSCHDVNTLFRSQSMASKIMYELMKFVGHEYLVISLKPLIDLIYAERKCCEIDPSKLKPGDSLDHNLRNITVYAELAFSRVVDPQQRCPKVLREVFSELRDVVQDRFPGREDVARLALSSFLIMRFFAAAILNPKLFLLKREAPDGNVSRTLVLVSKILQRLANCVVSVHPLTTKEQWLTPVLLRFLDDSHKSAMIHFLDGISTTSDDPKSLNNNDENFFLLLQQTKKEQPVLLKHGHMIERRCGSDKKKSLKNLIHQKRRYVFLTETQLCWQKIKDFSGSIADLQKHQQNFENAALGGAMTQLEHKGHFALSEITSVSPLADAKNSFRVTTPNSEVHFQASSLNEMNEWLILIQKQQRRHIMLLNRSPRDVTLKNKNSFSVTTYYDTEVDEVDMEREMHIMHSYLYDHYGTLCQWKSILESEQSAIIHRFQPPTLHSLHANISKSASALNMVHTSAPGLMTCSAKKENSNVRSTNKTTVMLPLEKLFNSMNTIDEREACLAKLYETIVTTIAAIQKIENTHQTAKKLSYQMRLLRQQNHAMNNINNNSNCENETENMDLPYDFIETTNATTTSSNINFSNERNSPGNLETSTAATAVFNGQKLIDNESYLHLCSGFKRLKKSAADLPHFKPTTSSAPTAM